MFLHIKRHLTKVFCEAYAKAANKQYEEAKAMTTTNHPAKDPDLSKEEQKFKELFCEVYSYEVANTYNLRFNFDPEHNTEDPISVTLFNKAGDKEFNTLTRDELIYKYVTKNW